MKRSVGLDDLVGCIELLQERIRAYEATLRKDETRTRMALIDPLLTALGWDVNDPSLVRPEYKVVDGKADYALLRTEESPAAIIEAKIHMAPNSTQRYGAIPLRIFRSTSSLPRRAE